MPAIATFIPFILVVSQVNQLHDLYYGADYNVFSIYTAPKQGSFDPFNVCLTHFSGAFFFYIIGYESSTLYAEAESRLFLTNESGSPAFLYMEEVKVFLNCNSSKHYFKLEERTGVIQTTTNKSNAAYFTLKTTPELHESGQFQLVHSTFDNGALERQHSELVMKFDFDSEYLTEDGPFKLFTSSGEYSNVLHFEIHGKSIALPALQERSQPS